MQWRVVCQLHQPGLHDPREGGLHHKRKPKDGLLGIMEPMKQLSKYQLRGGTKLKNKMRRKTRTKINEAAMKVNTLALVGNRAKTSN